MKIDPSLVKTILSTLKREYPNKVETSRYPRIDTPDAHRAMFYVAEKRLITSCEVSEREGIKQMLVAKLTAKGLDYLEKEEQETTKKKPAPSVLDAEELREFLSNILSSPQFNNSNELMVISRLRATTKQEIQTIVKRLIKVAARNPEAFVEAILENKSK